MTLLSYKCYSQILNKSLRHLPLTKLSLFPQRQVGRDDRSLLKTAQTFHDGRLRKSVVIGSYEEALGAHTTEVLMNYFCTLSTDSFWLDGGAGQANFYFDYLKNPRFSSKSKAKFIGINASLPPNFEKLRDWETNSPRSFAYYPLCKVEDFNADEFENKIDLITDIYGALSYTGDLSKVLYQYMKILKVGGKLFSCDSLFSTSICDRSEEIIEAPEENNIQLLIHSLKEDQSPFHIEIPRDQTPGGFILTKIHDQFKIHKTILCNREEGFPPKRAFIRLDNFWP